MFAHLCSRRSSRFLPVATVATALLTHAAAVAENLASFPVDAARLPAVRYASMAPDSCTRELTRRGVSFVALPKGGAPGVLAPIRLSGPLNGVVYRTALPQAERLTSPYEVFDCRLALALHDLSSILQSHEIDEVIMFSAWRPPPKSWPRAREADRHLGALAIDAQKFHKKTGEWLVIEDHYHGQIGAETCGPRAVPPSPETDEARELRSLVCEAADAHIFNGILTPNYNAAHFNHIHLEVKARVRWFLVR